MQRLDVGFGGAEIGNRSCLLSLVEYRECETIYGESNQTMLMRTQIVVPLIFRVVSYGVRVRSWSWRPFDAKERGGGRRLNQLWNVKES